MAAMGFVGLGVMGGAMAAHVWHKKSATDSLAVWNRSEARRKPMMALGVPIASSLQDLAESCEIIALCVNKTEDVEQCLVEIVPVARPGTLIIDHSTILPLAAAEIHSRLKSHGIGFVDAPITGGSMGAKNGTLTVFCGGEEADIERAKPMMSCYSRTAERVGGPGSGQMMKMANQIAVGGALLALCESLSFAEKSGLNLSQAHRLIGGGAAGSWAFENYGPKILARDWSPGFSIDNQVKDFHYCLATAASSGAAIPGTELVCRLLEEIQKEGHGDWTTAALFELMERM